MPTTTDVLNVQFFAYFILYQWTWNRHFSSEWHNDEDLQWQFYQTHLASGWQFSQNKNKIKKQEWKSGKYIVNFRYFVVYSIVIPMTRQNDTKSKETCV